MSPSRSAVAAAALAVLAAPARGGAILDVTGSVVSGPPALEVRVVVTNRGDAPASPLEVTGELLGQRREARVGAGVSPGGSAAVVLGFDAGSARPGVHALGLLLEHPLAGPTDAAGNPPLASQRAWLLVALGTSAPEAVRLAPEPLALDVFGALVVRLSSADGGAHRVRLRALTARGLRAEDEGSEVDVPARGDAVARLPLARAGAPRGSRHGVLVVAEAIDGDLARTTVATAPVDVAARRGWLERGRAGIAVLGGLLLALALGFEAWRRLRT